MTELLMQEQKEADLKKQIAELDKQIRARIEMQQALDLQLKEKEDMLKQQAEEDAYFKEQVS